MNRVELLYWAGYFACPQLGLQGITLLKRAVFCFVVVLHIATFNKCHVFGAYEVHWFWTAWRIQFFNSLSDMSEMSHYGMYALLSAVRTINLITPILIGYWRTCPAGGPTYKYHTRISQSQDKLILSIACPSKKGWLVRHVTHIYTESWDYVKNKFCFIIFRSMPQYGISSLPYCQTSLSRVHQTTEPNQGSKIARAMHGAEMSSI